MLKKKFRITIRLKLISTFILIMLVLAFVSFSSYTSTQKMSQESNNIVLDAIPISTAATDLLTDLVNEDSAVRGYLITGEERYLDPYYAGKKQLDDNLAIIRTHEDQHPVMKELIEQEAYPQIQNMQVYFESQISLVKTGKIQEARKKIDFGKQYMDTFREVNVKILADVAKLTSDNWTSSKNEGKRVELMILVGGGFALLVAIISAFLLIRSIIRPINMVNRQLKEIAEGEGDLTRQLAIQTNDELSDLAHSFNRMVSNLRSLISQVGLTSEQVAASAEELTASAEQTSKATEQVATIIQEVAEGADKQVHGVEESAKNINELSVGVQQIAASAQTVTASALIASQISNEGNQAIHTAVAQMQSISDTVDKLSDVVAGLGERSQEIGQIVETITTIAQQTNLLALNAAIEAARAGEQGRGFAVVADEVRKLAEQSAKSAQQITELITTIQSETKLAVQSMEVGTQEVSRGISLVNTAGESFEKIKLSVTDVATQIQEVSAASQQMSAGTEEVIKSIDSISEVTEMTAAGTQNVSAAAEEQLASMEEITSSASSLSKMAEELQALVGRFKV